MTGQRFVLVWDGQALAVATDRARAAGRSMVTSASEAGPGVLYVGDVGDSPAAQQAVLAALAGADLLLVCTAEVDVADALVDDLHRLGTVRHEEEAALLSAEQVALIRRLHAGQSLGEAAVAEHLSRRTADRRLAQARAALRVRTTPEALVAAARLGILDDQSED